MRSADDAKVANAIDELLLRIERIPYGNYRLVDSSGRDVAAEPPEPVSFARVQHICDFVADNLRRDIDANAIALHADIHPKYAMNIFRRSTGMTLNEYLNLLRLSFAPSDADQRRRRQCPPCRDEKRLRLAQRLKQVVPEDFGQVAVGLPPRLRPRLYRHPMPRHRDLGRVRLG